MNVDCLCSHSHPMSGTESCCSDGAKPSEIYEKKPFKIHHESNVYLKIVMLYYPFFFQKVKATQKIPLKYMQTKCHRKKAIT